MNEELKKVNGSINDVLNAIDSVSSKNSYSVYIPSLKRSVLFKEMNTGQEKAIIKTIIDNPVYNSGFIFTIRNIIKNNCLDKDINIDDLTLIDKIAICMTMRQKSIGNEFEYVFKGTKKTKLIKIDEYLEKIKSISIPSDEKVESESVSIVCSYPTIKTEYDLEKEFHSELSDLEINTPDDVKKTIGDVFINEIVKYIKEISIKQDSDSEMILNMDDFSFSDRIVIVEKIGNSVLRKVLKYIESSNKSINQILKIETDLNKEEKEKYNTDKLTGRLEAGSDFFITS